jgi:hypothetical protein
MEEKGKEKKRKRKQRRCSDASAGRRLSERSAAGGFSPSDVMYLFWILCSKYIISTTTVFKFFLYL